MMGRIRMTARSNPHDYTIKWAGRGLDSFGVIASSKPLFPVPEGLNPHDSKSPRGSGDHDKHDWAKPRHCGTTLPGSFPRS